MIDFFDISVPKFNEDERNKCDGVITEQECEKALKKMKNQKCPGSDGITTEFYKFILERNKGILMKSINFSFQNKEFTELQKQGTFTLLPKTGKDISVLENWRPISLLNVDKIIK